MTPQEKGAYRFTDDDPWAPPGPKQATFYACPGCGYPSIGLLDVDPAESRRVVDFARTKQDAWLPFAPGGKDFPDVPPAIAAAADEAHRCHSIDAHRGTLILARAVIEATCKDQGVNGSNLETRVDKLHELGKISEDVRDEAHEIRHIGNDMAHGDFEVGATEEDAAEMLEFMADILDAVYQRPERVKRRKGAREAAKEARAGDAAG